MKGFILGFVKLTWVDVIVGPNGDTTAVQLADLNKIMIVSFSISNLWKINMIMKKLTFLNVTGTSYLWKKGEVYLNGVSFVES